MIAKSVDEISLDTLVDMEAVLKNMEEISENFNNQIDEVFSKLEKMESIYKSRQSQKHSLREHKNLSEASVTS